MPLTLLLAWWNLIYIIPFTLALLYLGLFVFTGITFGDADADVDADVDGDVQVEAHVGVEADADADADADGDHDLGGDHDADSQAVGVAMVPHPGAINGSIDADAGGVHPVMAFLTLLGVGKIPVSLALMILLLSWGMVGFAINALLTQWMGGTFIVGVISMPITFVVSLTLTGLCAAAIAKIIPSDDSSRQRRQDLVGKAGEAIYDIDASFGMASVRGDAGDFFQIPCRTTEGKTRITKGTRIVIFDYDREQGIFHVAPYNA